MSIKNNKNQTRIASAIPVDLNENQTKSKKSAARLLRLAIPKMQQADIQQQQQQQIHQQQQQQHHMIPREVNAKLMQGEQNENSDYMVRLTSDDSCSSGSGSGIENPRYFSLQDGNRFMFIDEEHDFGNELSNRGECLFLNSYQTLVLFNPQCRNYFFCIVGNADILY